MYRLTELVGTSAVGFDEATRSAVDRAKKTLRNIDWFEVTEFRRAIHNDAIEYRAKVDVGFRLED